MIFNNYFSFALERNIFDLLVRSLEFEIIRKPLLTDSCVVTYVMVLYDINGFPTDGAIDIYHGGYIM